MFAGTNIYTVLHKKKGLFIPLNIDSYMSPTEKKQMIIL